MKLILRIAVFSLLLSIFSQNTFAAERVPATTCMERLESPISQNTVQIRQESGGRTIYSFLAYMSEVIVYVELITAPTYKAVNCFVEILEDT